MEAAKGRLFDKVKLWAEEGTPEQVLALWKKLGGRVVEKPEQATVLISDNEQAPLTREILTKRYNKFPHGVHRPVWSSEIIQYWAEEGDIITNPSVTKIYLRKAPVELSFEYLDLLETEESKSSAEDHNTFESCPERESTQAFTSPIHQSGTDRRRKPNSLDQTETCDMMHSSPARKPKVGVHVAPSAARRLREALWILPEPEYAERVSESSKKPSKKGGQGTKNILLKHIHRRGVVCQVCNPNGVKIRKPRSPDAHYHRRGAVCPACTSLMRSKDDPKEKQIDGDELTEPKNLPGSRSHRVSSLPDSRAAEENVRLHRTEARRLQEKRQDEKKRLDMNKRNMNARDEENDAGPAAENLQRLRARYAQYIECGMGISMVQIGREGFELRLENESQA